MFLNKAIFKKWIKEAYSHGGLRVGRVFDGFVLAGSHWGVWADEDEMPNWVKAAVIEYAGKLPEEGKVFRVQKDELEQYLIADDYMDLPSRFLEAKIPYTVTPIVYGGKYNAYRLLQDKRTLRIITLPEELYSVIDFSNLGKNDKNPNGAAENRPAGPVAASPSAGIVYWKNEQSALALCTALTGDGKANETISLLSEIDFGEEGK